MSGAYIDKKVVLTACVVVAFLVASSMLILFYNNEDKDNQLRLIGRVNTEGSGVYLKNDQYAGEYLEVDSFGKPVLDSDGKIQYHKEFWGGKIFGTPGTTSIQHMQLQTIVQKDLGLKFKPYINGESLSDDTVYYIPSITNAEAFISSSQSVPKLVGGIIWEPQYSSLIAGGCVKMMLTSDFEPGHTCCVIGASHDYITNHSDVTVRFLAAYNATVDRINDILKHPSSEDYRKLIESAKNQTGIKNESVIESALKNVNYTSKDTTYTSGSAPLADLEKTIAELADTYYSLGGVLKVSMDQMKFSGTHSFAQTFVDDGYLLKALGFGEPSPAGYSKATIRVAYISGDIHTSLALGFGTELGIFAQYGIVVSLSAAANGAGVATSLQNGEANFGFMGAPPILTTVINSKLVNA